MAITSLSRWATRAVASFPSTAIFFMTGPPGFRQCSFGRAIRAHPREAVCRTPRGEAPDREVSPRPPPGSRAEAQSLHVLGRFIALVHEHRRKLAFPQYNVALEASLGWMKQLTRYQAARQGRPTEWTSENLEAAR